MTAAVAFVAGFAVGVGGALAVLWAGTRRAARALDRDLTALYGVKRGLHEPFKEFVARCLQKRADRAAMQAIEDLTAEEIATARAEADARRGYHAGDA